MKTLDDEVMKLLGTLSLCMAERELKRVQTQDSKYESKTLDPTRKLLLHVEGC